MFGCDESRLLILQFILNTWLCCLFHVLLCKQRKRPTSAPSSLYTNHRDSLNNHYHIA